MQNDECRIKGCDAGLLLLHPFWILHSSFCILHTGRRLAADEPAGHAWEIESKDEG
jgi:hypothetical protein